MIFSFKEFAAHFCKSNDLLPRHKVRRIVSCCIMAANISYSQHKLAKFSHAFFAEDCCWLANELYKHWCMIFLEVNVTPRLKNKWHGQNICKTWSPCRQQSHRFQYDGYGAHSQLQSLKLGESAFLRCRVHHSHYTDLIKNIIWLPRHLVSSKCTRSSGVPRKLIIWIVIIEIHSWVYWVCTNLSQPSITIQRAY